MAGQHLGGNYPIKYYELATTTPLGELRNRNWSTTDPIIAAADRNLETFAELRAAFDLTQPATTDVIATSLDLNDTDNTAGVLDYQVIDGYVIASEPMLGRYSGGSEGAWAVELGYCKSGLELVSALVSSTTTQSPVFVIPAGIHQIRIWNIDLGGTNSSKDFQHSIDGGSTWVTDNNPPGLNFSRSEPAWECRDGVFSQNQCFEKDGITELVFSDTVIRCVPECVIPGIAVEEGETEETVTQGTNTSIPAGLKSVLISNLTGVTTVDGGFELGDNRRPNSIVLNASSHDHSFDGRLPAIALAGGTWQWISIE